MRERDLQAGLRGGATREERAAEERAWALVAAGLPPGSPSRRRPGVLRSALAVALACALVGGALTPPGDAVADWLGRAVGAAVPDPAPPAGPPARPPAAGRPLPGGGGSLLGSGSGGLAVVTARGADRLLGAVDAASWSPRGRFVAAARAAELIAVDATGRRRWSVVAPGTVRHPRWAPSGFRVAYLAAGRLRIVAGDGTAPRALAAARTTVAPAWRPGPGATGIAARHRIAYVQRDGRVAVRDADSGRLVGRSRARLQPRALAWTGDGTRLLVITAHRTVWLMPGGTATRFISAPRDAVFTRLAAAPRGRDYAVVVRRAGGTSEVMAVRDGHSAFLLGVPGPTRGLAWSPRGTWLAVASPASDAWLLLRPGARGLRAQRIVDEVVRRVGRGSPVRLEGWCCAR